MGLDVDFAVEGAGIRNHCYQLLDKRPKIFGILSTILEMALVPYI